MVQSEALGTEARPLPRQPWLEMGSLLPWTSTFRCRDCVNAPSSRHGQPASSSSPSSWLELSWLILPMVDQRPCLRRIHRFPIAVLTVPIRHSSAHRARPPLTSLPNSQQTAVLGLLEARPLLLRPSSMNLSNLLFQLFIHLTSKHSTAIRQE